jgi:dihydroxy-acid dehydratase
VFESIEDFTARIDDPDLEVDADAILVLKGCGPQGYPGMPEVGNMPLPRKLLERGITDMVRISDARMSGTAYGTVVLQVSPESAAGGPLALVRNGDVISLDVAGRSVHLDVSADELEERRTAWQAPPVEQERGYARLYVDHVQQANLGADFDFLLGSSGSEVKRESH